MNIQPQLPHGGFNTLRNGTGPTQIPSSGDAAPTGGLNHLRNGNGSDQIPAGIPQHHGAVDSFHATPHHKPHPIMHKPVGHTPTGGFNHLRNGQTGTTIPGANPTGGFNHLRTGQGSTEIPSGIARHLAAQADNQTNQGPSVASELA